MTYSRLLTLLMVPGAIACGSVSAKPDAGSEPSDGGTDSMDVDAAVPRFARVFHTVPQGQSGHLYSADIDNGVIGQARLLSGTPTNATASPGGVSVSADSKTIIYVSDAEVEGRTELYFLRFAASGPTMPVRISGAHGGTDAMVYFNALAPDGTHAIYGWGASNGFGITYTGIYFVDLSGASPGTPVPIFTGTSYTGPIVSKNVSRVAYSDNTTNACGVYVVDVSGLIPSTPARVNGLTNQNVSCGSLVFSPDGNRLAYVSDITTDDVYEMWLSNTSTTPAAPATKVNGAFVTGGDVVQGYLGGAMHSFTPDSKKLVYLADAMTDEVTELWIADVSGATPGTARKVNDTLVTNGDVGTGAFGFNFAFSGDSKKLVYLADQRSDETTEAVLVDISGAMPGVPQIVSGALVADGDALSPLLAPDGSGLTYVADQRMNDVYELFYVDLRGGTPSMPKPVNPNLGTTGDIMTSGLVYAVAFSPDGNKVGFVCDPMDTFNDVHVADVSTGTPAQQLVHHSTAVNGFPFKIEFTHDSQTLLYAMNPTGTYDIWASEIGGAMPGMPKKINSTPGPVSGSVPMFWIAPR